jgi:methylthioribose-1-phosphate isomerase
VVWKNNQLWLLDQTLLPHETQMLHCESVAAVFAAIQALKVRGAPAIGIAAAYGMVIDWQGPVALTALKERAHYLISARPTAVNLAWAVNRIVAVAVANAAAGEVPLSLLRAEAEAIHDEDKQACRAIGDHGAALLVERPNLLTHCNAGSLAVSEYGTALAPIYRAHEQGRELHVFVDETRPLLQGARLTSYELASAGVPHTLITDNMAAHVMSQGKVDAVIVGCDRVARNGDVANKIGTLNLAILCQHFAIPFYVACPISTIDIETATGAEITIENRHSDEVRGFAGFLASRADAPVFNPAFDVTPAALVSALITEVGVLHEPGEKEILSLFA